MAGSMFTSRKLHSGYFNFAVLAGLMLAARTFGQQRDSLLQALNLAQRDTLRATIMVRLAEQYGYTGDTGRNYALQAQELARANNFPRGKRAAAAFLGNYAFVHSDYDKAIKHYTDGLAASREMKSRKDEAGMMMGIGSAYFNKSDLENALNWQLQAMKLREGTHDLAGLSASYQNIANVLWYRQDFGQARAYNFKALAIQRQVGDRRGEASTLGNIGAIYASTGQYDTALVYFVQSLAIIRGLGNDRMLGTAIGNIGTVYEQKGELSKALEFQLEALKADEASENQEGVSTTLINLASLYIKMNNEEAGIKSYERSLSIAQEAGLLDNVKLIYQSLAEVYHRRREDARAYEYLGRYNAVKDSILNVANQESLNRLQELYESEKKDKELLEKDSELEKRELENGRQKLVLLFAGLLLVLVASFLVILFNRFKLIRRQKIIIEEKQKEILDSIRYARTIQRSLMPTDKSIAKTLTRLRGNKPVLRQN